jgi:hypothetical protein
VVSGNWYRPTSWSLPTFSRVICFSGENRSALYVLSYIGQPPVFVLGSPAAPADVAASQRAPASATAGRLPESIRFGRDLWWSICMLSGGEIIPATPCCKLRSVPQAQR